MSNTINIYTKATRNKKDWSVVPSIGWLPWTEKIRLCIFSTHLFINLTASLQIVQKTHNTFCHNHATSSESGGIQGQYWKQMCKHGTGSLLS